MDKSNLISALDKCIPSQLVHDLVDEFLAIRQDVATNTLGRTAPGKFVETLVQIMQFLDSGEYDAKPSVDEYLRNIESRNVQLDDGLRICAARVGRAMYALRNKRGIAHKGLDPSSYDLRFLHSAAQWVLAELIRVVSNLSMEEAGKLVEQIQAPIDRLVEDFGKHRLVLKDLPTKKEILVLLHNHYPNTLTTEEIISSLNRRNPKTVRNMLSLLWKQKAIELIKTSGYKLTQRGLSEAVAVIKSLY